MDSISVLAMLFAAVIPMPGLEVPQAQITPKQSSYKDFRFDVLYEPEKLMHEQFKIYQVVICVRPGNRTRVEKHVWFNVWKGHTFVCSAGLVPTSPEWLPISLRDRVKDPEAMLFTFEINPDFVEKSWLMYQVCGNNGRIERNCLLRLRDFIHVESRETDQAQSRPATSSASDPPTAPVIEMWNGGNYLARIKPYVLFAAWSDGTVVRRVDNKLKIGPASPDAIKRLLDEARSAGVQEPPLRHGLVKPDGPVNTLSVTLDGRRIRLDYGGATDFSDVGPKSSPSKEQLESFVRMWRRIERAIAAVQPSTTMEYAGNMQLEYPGPDTQPEAPSTRGTPAKQLEASKRGAH